MTSRYSRRRFLMRRFEMLMILLIFAALLSGCKKNLDRETALRLVAGVNLEVVEGLIDDDPGAYDSAKATSYQKLYDLKLLQCEQVPIWSASGPFRWTCGPGQAEGSAFRKAPGGMRNISYDAGYYQVTEILGITQSDNSASAQASAPFKASSLYSRYKQYLDPIDKGYPPPSQAPAVKSFQVNFLRYDDGWRMVR